MIYYFLILCFLIAVFYLINRKKPTNKTKYIFEDNISNLNEKEKTFWLLLSLYRDKAINVDVLACNVAYQHSHTMATDGKVSHSNYNERSNILMMQGAEKVSEIVGASSSIDIVFDKFKASAKHNKKVLDLSYNTCGISVIEVGNVKYITVIFIRI